ncbi:PREDICTED: F-box protein At2g16365-like [Camelina sativa]|uniref:F-box protein At2g16365-like n=1 Tax=Camelina sativa TaxID=90675 RepID=A0ABM0UVR6_CAMSA|nr:PREDICTED: F-box protein At2g16365-like [Camelina sativa]
MSEHVMGLSKINTQICVHGYQPAWLSRWTRRNRDGKCSKEINNLPEDGQLVKASTGSLKLKGKMLSGVLDLFPNPDSALPSVKLVPDMNNEPPIVADREDSIDGNEGQTSSAATQSMKVEHFQNNNTKLLSECKRIWSDSETNTRSQVKRLKTNTSYYSGNETDSMMAVEEGPSGKKVNYFFHRIIEINKPGSRRYQKPSASQIKNLNMGEDVNPWIQRWCKKKAGETHVPRGGKEVNPQSTALEKQFPSIAAMAMMKKALNGLNPTGCRKTNSLFVWNTEDLR